VCNPSRAVQEQAGDLGQELMSECSAPSPPLYGHSGPRSTGSRYNLVKPDYRMQDMPKEDSDPWPLSSRAVTEQNRSGQDGYTILQTLASGDGPPPP